jgi:hypothetical protein
MARPRRIVTELSVGLPAEMSNLLKFACENSELPPSIWTRIAIGEKLYRDGWPQRAANYLAQTTQQVAK